jgi:NAD(P)-dependent dehydrogenase (short-subunit alcohol dehydrogenase family)
VDTDRHRGRVVVVTGAGSGIGKATIMRLVKEGATVAGCDIDDVSVDQTAKELLDVGFKAAVLEVADVSSEADINHLVEAVIRVCGRVDAIANVAGIMDSFLPAHEVDDETWSRVMAVNVDGPMRLSRAVLPSMMAARSGVIVNVASEAGLRGAAGGFAYTAAKHAVIGQTRSIAWTYASSGIRCNAVCPGAIETNLGRTATRGSDWGVDQLRPVLRLRGKSAAPDTVASSISWLMSDEAANVNGAVLTVDAGWLAG